MREAQIGPRMIFEDCRRELSKFKLSLSLALPELGWGLFSQKGSLVEAKAWSALGIYLALEDLFQKALVVIFPGLLLWKQTLLQSFGAFIHFWSAILFKSFAKAISRTNFLELDSSLFPASECQTQVISLCSRSFAIVRAIPWYIALPSRLFALGSHPLKRLNLRNRPNCLSSCGSDNTVIFFAIRVKKIINALYLRSFALPGITLRGNYKADEVLILLSSELLLDFGQQIIEEILLLCFLSDNTLRFDGLDVLQRFYRQHLWLTQFFYIKLLIERN